MPANGSSTTGTLAVGGFWRTEHAHRALAPPRSRSPPNPDRRAAADLNEKPVCVSSPSTASVTASTRYRSVAYSACTPASSRSPPRDRVADLGPSIFVARGSIDDRPPLQVEGQRHLPVRRDVGLVLPVQLRDGRRGGGRREHVVLVRLGERGVLARAPDRLAHLVGGRVGRVRVTQPCAGDQADANPARLRERQPFDLAAERARLRLTGLLGVCLDGLVTRRRIDGRRASSSEVRHRCPQP